MTVEQVYHALKKLDMNAECIEGCIGSCELRVSKTSLSIGGITITPKNKK